MVNSSEPLTFTTCRVKVASSPSAAQVTAREACMQPFFLMKGSAAPTAISPRPASSIQPSRRISPRAGMLSTGSPAAGLTAMSHRETVCGYSAAVSAPSWLCT